MVLKCAFSRFRPRLRRPGLLGLAMLAGMVVTLTSSGRAFADTDPCSDPALRDATVESMLQVNVRGVDWPSITSTTHVTIPPKWQGTDGFFGDREQQRRSLACFMPTDTSADQPVFRSSPPVVAIEPPTRNAHVMTEITDAMTITDGPEASLSPWHEGLWLVVKRTWGYEVHFNSEGFITVPGHGAWTVKLVAPGLNIENPSRPPSTDDGRGTLTWSFPPSRALLPEVGFSVIGPWQVRMNLATDRWPTRWFSDASWTLGDGVIVYIVALWAVCRLLRRGRDDSYQRQLAISLAAISALGIACYVGYVIDDYLRHNAWNYNVLWKGEDITLIVIAVAYFMKAVGVRLRWVVVACAAAASVTAAITIPQAPYHYSYFTGDSREAAVAELVGLEVPLLATITLIGAGTVLWISRLWPFKPMEYQGLRNLDQTWLRGRRVIALVCGIFILGALVLGQSAASSYYYWVHTHFLGGDPGAFRWVAYDLLDDAHWWIGDGIQWALFFVIVVGIFAVLRVMSADARGVFFGVYAAGGQYKASERRDLMLMAAIVGSLFIGTWGFYDGISVPLPFIVTVVGLTVCGLTRKLSELDRKSKALGSRQNGSSAASQSLLVTYRNALLGASERIPAAAKPNKDTTVSAPDALGGDPKPDKKISALQTEIPLEPGTPDNPQGRGRRHMQLAVSSTSLEPHTLRLDKPVDPGVTALALGPADTWWDNGVAAFQAGKYLTIIPIAFDIYIIWNTGGLSQLGFPFGLQDALGAIASTAVAWLIGLFMFGALLPYLRGDRAPVKGIVFGLIAFAAFTADAVARHALGVTPYRTFVIDGLLAIALFATAGVLLDLQTLRNHNGDQGLISSLYQFGRLRVAATYLTTLIVVGVGVWQTVYLTNQTAQARSQTLSNAAQYAGSAVKH